MPNTSTYRYRDLGLQQIRLLTLLSPHHGPQIKGTLTAHNLASLPSYETISYVWGSGTKSNPIQIRAHKQDVHKNTAYEMLLIPQNAFSALLYLRRDDKPRVLWIDAICINQDDVGERNDQVALMANIYQRADTNLIHLTTDHDLAERVLRLIRDVDKVIRASTGDYALFSTTIRDPATGDLRYAAERDEKLDDLQVDAHTVSQLLSLPWFRRLWVVQEARNARTNICHLGSSKTLLITILRVVCWLDYIGALQHVSAPEARVGRRCMLEMFDLTDCEYGRFKTINLHFDHLLILAQNYEKTDPKDAVYALLGMLPRNVHRLTPNYRMSLTWILQEATRRVIELNKDLSILRFVHHREDEAQTNGTHDVPSWVRRTDWQYRNDLDPRPLQDLFHASQGFGKCNVTFAPEGELLLSGGCIDTIAKVSSTCRIESLQSAERLESWLCTSLLQLGIDGRSGDSDLSVKLNDLAYALAAERSSSGGRTKQEDLATVTHYLSALLSTDNARRAAYARMRSVCDLGDVRNRRLCITVNGRYGLVSQIAQQGDYVTILPGCNYPCLLRLRDTPQDGEKVYTFIGTGYISGVMYGEALPGRLALVRNKKTFQIV